MKRIADGAFALACVVVVCLVVRNQFVRASDTPVARTGVVAAGTAFPGLPTDAGRTTLVVYLSPTCSFCQESMPFYRTLAARARQGGATRVAYPMLGDEKEFKAYLSANGLDPEAAAPLQVVPGVRGTPTILSVRGGAVSGSWAGRLSAKQEGELLALLQ